MQLFACWVILHRFSRLLIFFKITYSKTSSRNTISVSNTLDPDQAQGSFGLDLGQNCLQSRRLTIVGEKFNKTRVSIFKS